MCSFTPSLHSTPTTTSVVDSSGNSSRKRKEVSFSQIAKLRRVKVADDDSKLQEAYSSWLTDEEVSSSKKRARNLSKVHYLKTRHDADAGSPMTARPNDRSGIVYNCHPAHYEIIGESLRGMEHITDASTSQKRIRLRSDTVSLIQKFQDQDTEDDVETSRSKLANKYRESAKEALIDAKVAAEEDAKAAAQILAEDLNQESH